MNHNKILPMDQRWGLPLPGPVAALASLIPGLGQFLLGYFWRGFMLFFMLTTLAALATWRMEDVGVTLKLLPPGLEPGDFSRPQQSAVSHALVTLALLAIVYIWNILDAFGCASGRPTPSRLPWILTSLATLIIGVHITQVDVGKAVREVDDIGPRLAQMLWPWDDVWVREEVYTDGIADWETPCDDTPPAARERVEGAAYIELSVTCGEPSGNRNPDGSRQEGTRILITGEGFRPGVPAEIIIKPGAIPDFRVVEGGERVQVIPDEGGQVQVEFAMPNFTIPATTIGTLPVEIKLRQTEEVGTSRLNEDFWLAFEGIIETIFLALIATAAGLVLAIPSSFLAAQNLMSFSPLAKGVYYVVRLIMNVVRSIEPIVWALIAIIWVGPGPFAGVLALTIHTIASLGKLYSEAIEEIDPGPIEAIQATGADRLQVILHAVVPQIIPPFISFTIYRWDINVRMSTIIGAVGGGGIGFILIQWIRLADYDAVGVGVWMIAIVVTVLDYASARIRQNYV
jgi:phosphonate transport system permease protein